MRGGTAFLVARLGILIILLFSSLVSFFVRPISIILFDAASLTTNPVSWTPDYPGVDFKTLLPHLINTLKRKSKVEQSMGSEEKVAKAVLDQQDEGSSRAEIEDGPPNEMIKSVLRSNIV